MGWDTMINEEAKTIVTILRHTKLVASCLENIAAVLSRRAIVHDISKFSEDEFSGFVQINRVARTCEYGSPEYKASLAEVDAVPLHYSRNSHHPEHFDNGVDEMSLIDFIEMVADWKAASEVYGQTLLKDALEIQTARFGLQERHLWLIRLILDELL
jgi:hypothetical protein